MPLEAAGETRVLNGLLTGVFVGLHTGAPSGANEVAGGGYVRQAYVYSLVGSNPTEAQNTNIIQFPVATATWGNLTHFGIWTAASGGSLVATGPLAATKNIDADDIARFPAGTLKVIAN